jgi:hypothetical protein
MTKNFVKDNLKPSHLSITGESCHHWKGGWQLAMGVHQHRFLLTSDNFWIKFEIGYEKNGSF